MQQETSMDIRYSGVIDYTPLFNFNPIQRPSAASPVKIGASNYQSDFYQAQNDLLQPLNQQNQAVFGVTDEGGVNLWA